MRPQAEQPVMGVPAPCCQRDAKGVLDMGHAVLQGDGRGGKAIKRDHVTRAISAQISAMIVG